MGGFKASQMVAGLDYDFTGVQVADEDDQEMLDQAKGTTPEPTTRQVRRMHARQNALLDLPPDTSPQELLREMASKSEDELVELDEELLDIISEITAGQPSREELAALPFRVRQSYYGWFLGEINNPTAGSGSTRRTLAPVKSG